MPAKHPRIMTVVDEEMAEWLRKRSQAEGRSVSLVVREILAKQYAEDEERFWAKEGEETEDSIDILYGCLKDLPGGSCRGTRIRAPSRTGSCRALAMSRSLIPDSSRSEMRSVDRTTGNQ